MILYPYLYYNLQNLFHMHMHQLRWELNVLGFTPYNVVSYLKEASTQHKHSIIPHVSHNSSHYARQTHGYNYIFFGQTITMTKE